jgi:hypothetical protein
MSTTLEPAAERLVEQIAQKTGKKPAEVLTAALMAHARATGALPQFASSSEERFNAMLVIANQAAQRPVFDSRTPGEIIGYNAFGLPE